MVQARPQHATFAEAALAILAILDDGDWHRSTDEIHEPLRPWVGEQMFGKVKSHYKIEHRRVGGVRTAGNTPQKVRKDEVDNEALTAD